MARGEHVSRTKITFAEYATAWLTLQKTEIRPRTYEVYEIAVRLHLDSVLGHKKPREDQLEPDAASRAR